MNNIQKEIRRFIVSGLCAVGTDMFFYYLLSWFMGLSVAKGISFCLGTVTAYLMNKYYTFGQKQKSWREIGRFAVVYAVSLSANISVNFISLYVLAGGTLVGETFWGADVHKLLAFLLATGTSTCINFIGQKFWVFKPNKEASI